jgi:WD40 repeat protein
MFKALAAKEINVGIENIVSFALGSDNTIAAFGVSDSVKLLNLSNSKMSEVLKLFMTVSVALVTLSSDGKKVLAGSEGNPNGWLWIGKSARTYLLDAGKPITAVALSPDGNQALTGSNNGMVRLWDVLSGSSEELKQGHTQAIRSIAFSSDGHNALSASEKEAILWNLQSDEFKEVKAKREIFSVALDPHCKQTFLAVEGNSIHLHNLESNSDRLVFSLDEPVGSLLTKSVAYSPDGNYVLVGSEDGKIYFLRFNEDKFIRIAIVDIPATLVTYSHNGTFIITIFKNIISQWYVGYLTGATSLENILLITMVALNNAVKIRKNSTWYAQFQQLPDYVRDGLQSRYKLRIVD